MFEIDVPINGNELFKKYRKTFVQELESSSDYPALKVNYRDQMHKLEDKIEVIHYLPFKNTYKVILEHLMKCFPGMVAGEEPFNSNKNVQVLNSSLSTLSRKHEILTDIYSDIDEINYPKEELETLFESLDNINSSFFIRKNRDLETGKETPVEMPAYDKMFIFKNVEALTKVTQALYKDRVRLEAFESVLDFTPGEKKKTSSKKAENITKSKRLFMDLSNRDEYKINGRPYFKKIDLEIADELNVSTQTVRKYRAELGLTENNQ